MIFFCKILGSSEVPDLFFRTYPLQQPCFIDELMFDILKNRVPCLHEQKVSKATAFGWLPHMTECAKRIEKWDSLGNVLHGGTWPDIAIKKKYNPGVMIV